MHQADTGASSGGTKATAQDHSAAPVCARPNVPGRQDSLLTSIQGPVMAEGLGEPASKEDLKKRAAELNK